MRKTAFSALLLNLNPKTKGSVNITLACKLNWWFEDFAATACQVIQLLSHWRGRPCKKLVTGQDTGRMKMCCRNAEAEQFWKQARRAAQAWSGAEPGRRSGKAGKSGRSAVRRKQGPAGQRQRRKQEGKGQYQMLPGAYFEYNQFYFAILIK